MKIVRTRMFKLFLPFLVICSLVLSSSVSLGQIDSEDNVDNDAINLDQIEAEIEKGKTDQSEQNQNSNATVETNKGVSPQTLSDLGRLAPFSEVSVLQKRFQPKTGRFQIGLGLGGITNDPWFQSLGSTLRFAYHFSESWAIEGVGTFLSNSERDSAKDLKSNISVSTSLIVSTKNYYGFDIMWSPIYGKMSLYNNKILPFDMYFTGGMGQSTVDGASQSQIQTFHLGTGQVYAMTKSWGVRWDLSWNTFEASQQLQSSSTESKTRFNNILLMIGGSFFFPEVKYR